MVYILPYLWSFRHSLKTRWLHKIPLCKKGKSGVSCELTRRRAHLAEECHNISTNFKDGSLNANEFVGSYLEKRVECAWRKNEFGCFFIFLLRVSHVYLLYFPIILLIILNAINRNPAAGVEILIYDI